MMIMQEITSLDKQNKGKTNQNNYQTATFSESEKSVGFKGIVSCCGPGLRPLCLWIRVH